MKRKIFLIIVIAIIVVGFIACLAMLFRSDKNEIILETNGGVPYIWEYEIKNPDIVKYKKTVVEKQNNLAGGPVKEHYIFEGIKEGSTTITFEYKHITDNSIDKTKKYKVIVNKKLELKIIEIKQLK